MPTDNPSCSLPTIIYKSTWLWHTQLSEHPCCCKIPLFLLPATKAAVGSWRSGRVNFTGRLLFQEWNWLCSYAWGCNGYKSAKFLSTPAFTLSSRCAPVIFLHSFYELWHDPVFRQVGTLHLWKKMAPVGVCQYWTLHYNHRFVYDANLWMTEISFFGLFLPVSVHWRSTTSNEPKRIWSDWIWNLSPRVRASSPNCPAIPQKWPFLPVPFLWT